MKKGILALLVVVACWGSTLQANDWKNAPISEVQKAAEATELPVVTVRQEGNETITEYRKRGKIFAQYFKSKDTGSEKWYVDPNYQGPMPPDLDAGMHGKPGAVQYKVFGW